MAIIQKCKPLAGISLNYEVVGGTTAPTTFNKENTIWVNTDIAIGEHVFGYEEPWVYYEDVNLLDGVTLDGYYLTSSGGLEGPTAANPEKYTVDYIPVTYGVTYEVSYTVSATNSMWFAVCEYTGSYTFKQRLVPVSSVSGTSQNFTYTPSASNVNAVRLSWRTFPNATYETSFICRNVKKSSAPVGNIWIPTDIDNATISFNALKKNELKVYPLAPKLGNGNRWKKVAGSIYKNGTSVLDYTVDEQLFPNGRDWESLECGSHWVINSATRTSIIIKSEWWNQGTRAIVTTKEPVDLTDYATLTAVFNVVGIGDTNSPYNNWVVGLNTIKAYASATKSLKVSGNGTYTMTVDVSAMSGEYYILFGGVNNNSNATCTLSSIILTTT